MFPARPAPAPTTISHEAQTAVSVGSPLGPILFSEPEPAPNDVDGWRDFLRRRDTEVAPFLDTFVERYPCTVTPHTVSGVRVYELLADPAPRPANGTTAIVLYLHGGGYTSGGGEATAHLARPVAHGLGLPIWAPDYRLPPEHPFPAAVDDAVAAYAFLLEHHPPQQIVVAGRSAGGGLAAATVLRARDEGLPLPAACLLQTPEADLTESGDTFRLNDGIDNYLRPLPHANALYANGHDLRHPYVSPLYGDFEAGFPPTILTSGTRDLFLSNTVLLHRALRRAGVPADLHVWEAMGHGGFFETAPEDREVWSELRAFVQSVAAT